MPATPQPLNDVPATPQLRILTLLTDGFGGRGGIAKFNRDLLRALCSYPATARVVALPRLAPDPLPELARQLEYRLDGLGGYVRYARALMRLLAREPRFDFVVCAHINLLPLATLASARYRAKNTLIVHGVDVWQPTPRRLTNFLVPHVDSFISVSEHTKQRFLAWAALREDRGYVLPNCVDLERFTPGRKRADLLHRYGLEDSVVLMTLARLSSAERYKGVDEVLEVLPALARRIPNLRYLVVGDGDDRPRVEAKSVSLGVRERVVFTGYIDEREKVDHYRLADAFVMPSRGEGFGIVFLEAMACGIPTVASSLDAGREAVRDSEIGVLVDPCDLDDVQAGILRALELPRGVAPAGIDYFSSQRFDARLHATLAKLLDSKPESRGGARSQCTHEVVSQET